MKTGDCFLIKAEEKFFLVQYYTKKDNGIPLILVYFNHSFKTRNGVNDEIKKCIESNQYYELNFMLPGLKKQEIKYIDNFELPHNFKESRYIRDAIMTREGILKGWSIFDKEKNRYNFYEKLTEDQLSIPPDGIRSYPLLIERLNNNRSPETWK